MATTLAAYTYINTHDMYLQFWWCVSAYVQKSYAYAQAGKLACLIRKPYTILQLQMDRRFGPLWHDHAQPRVAHLKLRLSRETSGLAHSGRDGRSILGDRWIR